MLAWLRRAKRFPPSRQRQRSRPRVYREYVLERRRKFHRAVRGGEWCLMSPRLSRVRSVGCRAPDDCVLGDTTQQRNTHIRDVREIHYPFHAWHGRAVLVHASLVRRGRPVAYCSLEDENGRVLEVPLWMLDLATCSKTQVSVGGRCLTKMLPVPKRWNGNNEEAIEHGSEAGTDRSSG